MSDWETIATELRVLADGLDQSAQFLEQSAGTLRGLADRVQQMEVEFCRSEANYLLRIATLEQEKSK